MHRPPSRIHTACVVAVLLVPILLGGYLGVYFWRHRQTHGIWTAYYAPDGSLDTHLVVYFPTAFEQRCFWPLIEMHQRISPDSYLAPAEQNIVGPGDHPANPHGRRVELIRIDNTD